MYRKGGSGKSGRKRKTPLDWAREHPDELETKKMLGTDGNPFCEILTCKFCSVELDLTSGKKPWDRINEHLNSKRHKRMKANYEKRLQEGKQLTLYESEVRVRSKEREAETVAHDFTRALLYSGLSLNKADGYMGKLFRKYCPAARTMPGSRQLSRKYLPEIYEQHISSVKEKIARRRISVILDESPDVIGRPAINTLISFYNSLSNRKTVLLVDTSIVKSCNSTTAALTVSQALNNVNKSWTDVLGLSSDSAAYMQKLYTDVKAAYNPRLLHFTDVAHLIHVAVDTALHSPSMLVLHKVVTKFGAIFKHAQKLEGLYKEICRINGLEEQICKPPAVVQTRWYSFYESAVKTKFLWRFLLLFIDSPSSKDSEKVNSLAELLGTTTNRQHLYTKLTFLLEVLKPIHQIQKQLESNEPFLHRMYHTVAVNLQVEISKYGGAFTMGAETTALLNMLSERDGLAVKSDLLQFGKALSDKWQDTTQRNLQDDVVQLWYRAIVLDPFLKSAQSPNFEDYTDMFSLVVDDLSDIEKEFPKYLQEPIPSNLEVFILDYWKGLETLYPNLSPAVTELLSISTGSCDVECSFSMMKAVQQPNRSLMTENTLRMEMVLYFNKDLDHDFDNY